MVPPDRDPLGMTSESESASPCRLRERFHTPVILISRPVEHHLADSSGFGPLGDQLPHDLGGGDVPAVRLALAEFRAPAVHRHQGSTRGVVDQLRVDVVEAAKHRQPRPPRGALDAPTHAHMPDLPPLDLVAREHHLAPAFLPTLRRICSSAYLMPFP